MRSGSLLTAAAAAIILGISAIAGVAQDAAAPAQKSPVADAVKPVDRKPNLLAQLGLSKEQIQQIRALNVERKPLMVAAQDRLRSANLALDEAIYADSPNAEDVDARVKAVQAAQAEVVSIRSANELAVRRVLTPDQLIRFREIRQRFNEARQQIQTRRKARRAAKSTDAAQPPNMFKRRGRPI